MAAPEARGSRVGERIGARFTVVELAGKGAAGEVYRALDELTGAPVAVKCLGGLVEDDRAEDRFAREVRLLAAISNPHVARYVGHGRTPDDRAYVAVEWLDGVDLARRQRTRPLDGREIVEVIEQTASGLAAIHAVGAVHRDVKPTNILVSDGADGRLRVTVIDLGVAYASAEPWLTRPGMIIGTPTYMSPEQILARRTIGPRSDVFSLGVVLFQLVTGRKPYEGEDVLAIVAKIALQDPPRVVDVFPEAPPELDAVVWRAMARDPAERFASVTAFAEALGAVPPFRPLTAKVSRTDETEVLSQPSATDGITAQSVERRVVTAVFARFARAEDAEAAATVFDRVAKRFGGTPHALLSIAHVAVFGGAHSTGEEAPRAARAALALAKEIRAAAISIVTARAAAGAAGLSSDAIDRGAKSSGLAASIRVDEPTARLLGDAFDVASAEGERTLVAEHGVEGRAPTFLGSATPCVGRERELARLDALFDEVVTESVARVAILVAGPGAGKSRVRRELVAQFAARADAPLVIFGRGNALVEGAPFGLVGSAIRGLADVRDDDPPAVALEKIGALVRGADRESVVPRLAQIASIGDARPSPDDDGMLASDRLKQAFVAWLGALAADRAIALVFEDVQWADAPSIALVDGALRNLAERPLFVLAVARPEVAARFPALWEDRGPLALRLPKLSRKASEALVRHATGDAIDPVVRERIIARADGNAFYLEELLRACVEARAAGREAGAFDLPDTVLGMVQARLDALGPEAKRLCKAASIFGESAWASGVAAVLGLADGTVAIESEMARLTVREAFERRSESRFSGESEFVFRHALLRDAAYELLLEEDRAVSHLRAAEWLEAHGERDALVLARHFELGNAPGRAEPHYRRAAEQALWGSDFARAIACAERALATVEGATRGELLLLLAEAKRWSGDLAGALDAASRASSKLPLGSTPWFSAMRELVAAHGRLGNKAAIAPIAAKLLDAVAEPGAVSAQVAALVPAAVHLLYGGDSASAEALSLEIEAIADRTPSLEPRARARLHQLRAALATHKDDAEVGIAEQAKALEQFDAAGDQRAGALVRTNMSFALLQLGNLTRAEAMLRVALDAAARLGLESVRALALQNLGTALAWQGLHDEALAAQSKAADLFALHKDPRLEGTSRVHLAVLHLARGELDRAERTARFVIEGGVEPLEVGARAALAKVHLARGEHPAALAEARRSSAVLERLGSVEEFEMLARTTLAEALAASGLEEEARAALERAKQRVVARRDKVRDEGLKRSVVEGIPEHARVFALWEKASAR